MLFTSPDYELVVMPMLTNESQQPKVEEKTAEPDLSAEASAKVGAEAEQAEVEEAETAQAVAEAEEITKAKQNGSTRRKSRSPCNHKPKMNA